MRNFRVEIRVSRDKESEAAIWVAWVWSRVAFAGSCISCVFGLVWFDFAGNHTEKTRWLQITSKDRRTYWKQIYFFQKNWYLTLWWGVHLDKQAKLDEPIHTSNSCKNYKWSQIWKTATFQWTTAKILTVIRDEITGDFEGKKGHTGMIANVQVQVDPHDPHVENQKKRNLMKMSLQDVKNRLTTAKTVSLMTIMWTKYPKTKGLLICQELLTSKSWFIMGPNWPKHFF